MTINFNSKVISNSTKNSTLNNSNKGTDMPHREHEDSLVLELGYTSSNARDTSNDSERHLPRLHLLLGEIIRPRLWSFAKNKGGVSS
jgi:hypothetical protein